MVQWKMARCLKVTLPETNIFAENRPKLNRKGLYSNHPFLGAKMLVFGSVTILRGEPFFTSSMIMGGREGTPPIPGCGLRPGSHQDDMKANLF